MNDKKICMLGACGVGKTSLVRQYVHSLFTDKRLPNVGVKISKKTIIHNSRESSLVLWDLDSKNGSEDINVAYLRGAMGFFVVADGTREETLETALSLRIRALDCLGPVPHVLLINKADLASSWEIGKEQIASMTQQGIRVVKTSAKTGLGVSEAFMSLANAIL